MKNSKKKSLKNTLLLHAWNKHGTWDAWNTNGTINADRE